MARKPDGMLKRSLFIFRRDLRVADNSGLIAAAAAAKHVIPCFIFDPAILARFEGHGFRLAFLLASLTDLDKQLAACGGNLRIFTGKPHEVVNGLLAEGEIDGVFVNRDYTPHAIRRDRKLRDVCEAAGAAFTVCADALLNEPEVVKKADGDPYVVFTPYHRAASSHKVEAPVYERPDNLLAKGAPGDAFSRADKPKCDASLDITPGRDGALAILRDIEALADYEGTRDFPAITGGTSRLSAHLRFGTCSPREAWHAIARGLGKGHALLRQLYWRDFFTQVAFHHPHVFGQAFRREYDAIPWRDDDADFTRWCEGKTGFPIVDAAMHELVETGYMHNRVRMVVASFLVKNLHIDWRKGEAFFARYLIDYDPCVNNGNWQWAASTGCDAQPYFRVFNPWRQQQRFDPDATYIKRWVPALADWDAGDIHRIEKDASGYLSPIVDLKASAAEIKARFKDAAQAR